ncbi:hypothetical protein ACHAWF_011682 [Thalassiosira exigua]
MVIASSKPRILSIANALAYGLNAVETFGFGPFSSRFGPDQDNGSVSQKYQTIVTPNGVAFSIWGLVFLSQAACVLLTLFSSRRTNHPLMATGVSWYFVAVCLAQFAWSYAVTTKNIEQEISSTNFETWDWTDYWLLRFPFELHLGWISAAFILNLNIVVVDSGAGADVQAAVAGVSLAVLVALSFVCLFVVARPQFTIPSVLAWATFWMSYELRSPKQLILDTFSSGQIRSFFVATSALSGMLIVATLICWVHHRFMAPKPNEMSVGQANGEALLSGDAHRPGQSVEVS